MSPSHTRGPHVDGGFERSPPEFIHDIMPKLEQHTKKHHDITSQSRACHGIAFDHQGSESETQKFRDDSSQPLIRKASPYYFSLSS